MGTYMHSVVDAKNLGMNTVCRTTHKVVLALIGLLNMFVVLPGHLLILAIKEAFHKIVGGIHNSSLYY